MVLADRKNDLNKKGNTPQFRTLSSLYVIRLYQYAIRMGHVFPVCRPRNLNLQSKACETCEHPSETSLCRLAITYTDRLFLWDAWGVRRCVRNTNLSPDLTATFFTPSSLFH